MDYIELNFLMVKFNISIEYKNDRPFNDSRYSVDDSKIRNLGWSPEESVVESIPDLIEWYRSNLNRYIYIIFLLIWIIYRCINSYIEKYKTKLKTCTDANKNQIKERC